MQNNNAASVSSNGIKNSWPLVSFAKMKGRMQVGQFTNSETGDSWKSCVFTDPSNPDNKTNKTFVAFSRNLGELSPQEIAEQKDELQVVECTTADGKDMYALCKAGQNAWQDVDLGF